MATEPGFKKFQRIKPKAVALPQGDLVTMRTLRPGEDLPLVVEPAVDDVDPVEWARENRELIEEKLLAHGAILFRGFGIEDTERFERTAMAVTPALVEDNGELPRSNISEKVYAVSYAPPSERILWHNENSFCPSWPMKLWFCCVQPAEEGGETPLVDNRKVLARLDPEVREAFRSRGIMYLRNFGRGLDFSWQTAFRTDDKAQVEAQCRAAGIEVEWKEDDGLRTRSVRPAVLRHPKTGEEVFFCQPALWHIACNPPQVRRAKLAFFAEEDLTRHCYYGDGSPIADEVIQRILEIYRETQVMFPWQKEDLVLVDNMLTAHARNPCAGRLVIYAAMAEMVSGEAF